MNPLFKFVVFTFLIILLSEYIADADSSVGILASTNDSELCVKCHDETAPDWKDSAHSTSLVDPGIIKALKKTLVRLPESERIQIRQTCLTCHIPQIKDASDKLVEELALLIITADDTTDPAGSEAAHNELKNLSIDCRVCHVINALPDGQGKKNIIYGPGWNEHEHSHKEEYGFDTLKSDHLTSSAFCSSCHIECSSEKATAAYKEVHDCFDDHYAGENKSCQYCHMKSNFLNNHSFTVGSY